MEFRLGEKFHSFVVLDICGRGAFGEVYRVHDLSNKILALKVIRKFGLSGDNWRKELQGLILQAMSLALSPDLNLVLYRY